MVTLQKILSATRSLDKEKQDFIAKAFHFATKVHKKELRHYSTEPIDTHVKRVALVLAELGMAHESIAAGLLHHTLREGKVPIGTLISEFGESVALLVERATALRDIKYRDGMKNVESLQKLFVASAKDIRILIIKLADRLDSMRHLYLNKKHHKRISKETMEIYVPLAYRLGLRTITREMEDLSFQYLEPRTYEKLEKALKQEQGASEKQLEQFRKILLKRLAISCIGKLEIDTRLKGIYSLHTKMKSKENDISRIHDLLAIRVRVETIEECYCVLGVIHAHWRPLPGRIKDYIASPKLNGYKSLHTTIFTGEGAIVEIQIRTHQMHDQAEYGVASHLAYKERNKGAADPYYSWFNQFLSLDDGSKRSKGKYTYIPEWLKDIIQMQSNTIDEASVVTALKSDFFQKRMFVFDTKGDVVDLPVHSTLVDFAYESDPSVGKHLHRAKVNGTFVTIDTELKNGDIVEIATKRSRRPTKQWLKYVRTTLARREIENFLSSDAT